MQSSSAHLLIEVKNTNSLVPKFSSDSYLITLDVDAILHTSLLDLQVHNLNLYNSTDIEFKLNGKNKMRIKLLFVIVTIFEAS